MSNLITGTDFGKNAPDPKRRIITDLTQQAAEATDRSPVPDKSAEQGYTDYKPFFKGQIDETALERGLKRDPFAGETPTTEKDYSEYQQFYEGTMRDALRHQGMLKQSSACEVMLDGKRHLVSGKKTGHLGADFVFACDHIITQDSTHPEGLYMYPLSRAEKAFCYLCPTCFKNSEHSPAMKVRVFEMLCQKCSMCFKQKVMEIQAIKPDLVIDLSKV